MDGEGEGTGVFSPEQIELVREPFAWMVFVENSDVDYLVFASRQEAIDECLHQLDNSDAKTWNLWPLHQSQPEPISFD